MQSNSQSNKNEQGVNLVDLSVYLLSKWKWFVLSVLVFGGLAWYHYATSPLVFFRSVTVIIKDPSNKTSTAGLDRYDNYINKVNVANEILQFRSKRLMREVVQRLHADVDYRMEKGLRTDELYNLSPVSVSFINVMPERRISFAVTPRGGNTVTLSAFEGLPSAKESYDVRLNDTLKVGELADGRVKIPAGWMIDQCGWKGKALGPAAVHDKQALVLVNRGGAKGSDIIALSDAVRASVREKFGIDIHPEVNFIN